MKKERKERNVHRLPVCADSERPKSWSHSYWQSFISDKIY